VRESMTRMPCPSLAGLAPTTTANGGWPECAIIGWGSQVDSIDWDHRYMADAEAGGNVMPAAVEAVKQYASVGELTKCLVDVYGRYEEPVCLYKLA